MKLFRKIEDSYRYWSQCWNVKDEDSVSFELDLGDEEALAMTMTGDIFKLLVKTLIKMEYRLDDEDDAFGPVHQVQFYRTLIHLYETGNLTMSTVSALLHPEMYFSDAELAEMGGLEVEVELENE